jgi:nicotinamide-nucleotide amidase
MTALSQEIGEMLKERKLTLGVAESATGGLISHLITNFPGSSDYYQGSITSYSNEIKIRLLGVKRETLDKYGAVSAQVAEEMAAGGRKALGVDICIADTGIAGPTGATTGKPIGLFYLSLSHRGGTFNRKLVFNGNREQNKDRAAEAALEWVKEYLSGLDRSPKKNITIQVKDVVTCFLESNHRILILHRSAQVGTYQGLWAAVSGYIETTPDEQALTEIREETGLGPKDVKLKWKGQTVEALDEKLKTRWIIHPYLFRVKNPDRIKYDWEHTETRWILPSELVDYTTVPKLKEALDTVVNQI